MVRVRDLHQHVSGMKRVAALVEVGLVLALFLILRTQIKGTGFAAWQASALGGAIVSSAVLFFVLPMSVMIATRRNPGRFGLTTENLRYHARVAWRAVRGYKRAAKEEKGSP